VFPFEVALKALFVVVEEEVGVFGADFREGEVGDCFGWECDGEVDNIVFEGLNLCHNWKSKALIRRSIDLSLFQIAYP